jgi:hypothetical protein
VQSGAEYREELERITDLILSACARLGRTPLKQRRKTLPGRRQVRKRYDDADDAAAIFLNAVQCEVGRKLGDPLNLRPGKVV